MRDTEGYQSFGDWLSRYGRAWEEGDAEAAVALFTEDAIYHEVPFEAPMIGTAAIRRYWEDGAVTTQRDIAFSFTVLSFQHDTGIAHWEAGFTRLPSGARVELDGILMAMFDQDGRCRIFREWWHRKE